MYGSSLISAISALQQIDSIGQVNQRAGNGLTLDGKGNKVTALLSLEAFVNLKVIAQGIYIFFPNGILLCSSYHIMVQMIIKTWDFGNNFPCYVGKEAILLWVAGSG